MGARRIGGQITDSDSPADAEHKAAMAEAALCEVLIDHFRRVVSMIDYATTRGHADQLAQLYQVAFSASAIPAAQIASLTSTSAHELAKRITSELALGVHSLDWAAPDSGESTEDSLLRKSRAVVNEDQLLNQLQSVSSHLKVFENTLTEHTWSAEFRASNPSPSGCKK
ncbi:hypothetical protein EEB14_33385 [Rhodococcus sp. WS4]|nr:hypothetical protein EEB14_33385 [Rhodococcus sp. WS4]